MKMFVKDVLPSIKDPKTLVAAADVTSGDDAIPEQFGSVLSGI